jgi:hypothetical protein
MTLLTTIAERVEDCFVAAWVDTRRGVVLERHAPHEQPFVASALDAAIEVMRTPERPPRMVLLSEHHLHIVQRTAHDPHRVLVVICGRSQNLGLAVSLVRMLMDGAQVEGEQMEGEQMEGRTA